MTTVNNRLRDHIEPWPTMISCYCTILRELVNQYLKSYLMVIHEHNYPRVIHRITKSMELYQHFVRHFFTSQTLTLLDIFSKACVPRPCPMHGKSATKMTKFGAFKMRNPAEAAAAAVVPSTSEPLGKNLN